MFEQDKDIIAYALSMWANHIETNDVTMSQNDAVNMKQHQKIQPLSTHQMEFVLRLRKMSQKALNSNIKLE